MIKTLIAPLLLVVSTLLAAPVPFAQAADYDPFARDIKILSKWFVSKESDRQAMIKYNEENAK